MNSVLTSVRSLMHTFDGKAKEFTDEIENVHMVWLEEIQQEANRMFSRDFNAEPELMPKTPSQKKSRKKRLSSGHQEENPARRRFSKGKRSNLRGSVVKSLNLITEEEIIPEASTSQTDPPWQPKRTTRKNNNKLQTQSEEAEDVSLKPEEVQNKKPELVEVDKPELVEVDKPELVEVDKPELVEVDKPELVEVDKPELVEVDKPDYICGDAQSPPSPEVTVSISASDRLSAESVKDVQVSACHSAAKIAIAGAARSSRQSSRRSSVRCSLKVRHSLAGLRHSMTLESVRRASRRSILKRQVSRMGNSICSSNIDEHSSVDSVEGMEAMPEAVSTDSDENPAAEECIGTLESQIIQIPQPSFGRITRSAAANSAAALSPFTSELSVFTPKKKTETHLMAVRMSRLSQKRKAPDASEESSTKKYSPPKKSASAMRPHMKSFLHTVQKNQLLMMTPNSLGRPAVFKSFIKQNTPLKMDPKTKERYKLEALQKKHEQEEERMKKMEEEKKKKHDEFKRKRDERLKRVLEAKVKEEQREVEKKKKTEQKMIQIDERNDKRQVEENKKKKLAVKRQEDLEQRKKQEEEAKTKIQQAEEEKKQQELLAKKKAEEEEQRTRKLAEARRALELKREQERERLAATEREREEKEKALVLQRELERAAREKEKRMALEENRRLEEEQLRLAAVEVAAKEREAAAKKAAEAQKATASLNVTVEIERSVLSTPVGKGAGLNVTVDLEKSPQSYSLTPKGRNKPTTSKTAEDYGMDQNSDDSTDDESAPRKPIPSWAEGHMLQQIIVKQYFNPPNFESFLGIIEPPKLEAIFNKKKPRYFKRTSSAVWHSPPHGRK
ncbi:inner centromere protein A isoform X2 [Gymnodraco acuticeps]|uniref:Inner centromere protein A isoform X2 n=1 Tax=Gymnodraco acuticeps TaxID=8218 RepID=A0A6P8TAA3_GYMAC|nr:inner centromere protein A isoform X2 [Gymnodraco acuticeps]